MQGTTKISIPGWYHRPAVGDRPLEANLRWPAGTIGWLRAAFDSGATRSQWWDLLGLPDDQQAAVRAAARVFRRGVGVGEPLGRGESLISDCFVHAGLEDLVTALTDGRKARLCMVIDAHFANHWPHLCHQLARVTGKDPGLISVSEDAKSLPTAADLVAMIHDSCGDDAMVVAVGGGITLDLVGFAAGVAGRDWIAVPTTLLAMVDAAHGGKTGINFAPWGKNQVGLFHAPRSVQIHTHFLSTLPPPEFIAGVSECLKHALLAGDLNAFHAWINLTHGTDRWSDLNSCDVLASLVEKSYRYKARIVDSDPWEDGGTGATQSGSYDSACSGGSGCRDSPPGNG